MPVILQGHTRLVTSCCGLQDENGGAGVYQQDVRKRYLLEDDSWRHDIIPEIMDGHNVMDFVDPDIEAKLDALDREEDSQMAALAAQVQPGQGLASASLPALFPHQHRLGAGVHCRHGTSTCVQPG